MRVDYELHKHFEDSVEKMVEVYGEKFLKLNGLSNEHLNGTGFIDNFIDKQTVSDASIDGNANVGTKDICSMTSEKNKSTDKLLAFNKIFYELEKKHGLEKAQKWLEGEWNGAFYMHDASSATFVPYCFAYDLEPLVEKGLFFIDNFSGGAPKHLTTFTDFVVEWVCYASSRSSGAVGLPNFLIYSYYFWKKDCETGHFIKDPEYYCRQEFQRIIYKLNQPYVRINQSAFTNVTIYDKPYLEALFGGKEYPDGSAVIDYIDEICEYQKIFMEVCSEVRNANLMTFPVLTFALLYDGTQFVDEEFAMWACRHNMKWGDSNFFVSEDVTSLSNCCRLISDVKDLGFFNSIGGTALEVGSVKVNTINLARIAYEADGDREAYFEILAEKVQLCCETLDIVRSIISRNIEKGLLPNYTHKLINLSSQYNTIGILGIYETLKFFGHVIVDEFGNSSYDSAGVQFAEDILAKINECRIDFMKNVDYKINVEQIPGERAAAILMQKDKLLFPNGIYELPLYGNQWI
ncbi:MAG: anaerobic ribonucleoside-triphosphate reductase, partial [Clostridiales bacterium]|nr:anaerobic ribonucleoside-triphosphate reductase [Clostridiales bacterium]